jgi:ribosomal protein L14
MNVSEAATVSIALASLKLQSGPAGPIERFSADIGDIIRANLKDANPADLINLAKSTHYLR